MYSRSDVQGNIPPNYRRERTTPPGTTCYEYDQQACLVKTTDPLGRTRILAYDPTLGKTVEEVAFSRREPEAPHYLRSASIGGTDEAETAG